VLQIIDLDVSYGQIQALKGTSLHVQQGEVVTLIGANGAGKSTLLHTISGIIRPLHGSILVYDQEIKKRSADEIVKMGISQVVEGRAILTRMTVQENLEMGAFLRRDSDGIRRDMEAIFKRFPLLLERKNKLALTLSGGEQQMLAIGRALMSRPKLLMMDEPSLGLAPLLVTEIFKIIRELNREGITILLVEQNAKKALQVANRGYVIETGRIVHEGLGEALLKDKKVQEAYLGGLS
jgi:branched-chain amino acid transport system ATP-binding protein